MGPFPRDRAKSPVRLSITTPVLTKLPGSSADWEGAGSFDDVTRIACAADRLGYNHMTCSEHVAVPTEEQHRRGARYWDPLPTFGYMAARTTRLRFMTNVLVLPYHHPLEIAKRYGTLDVISGGRLILGVGVGSLQQEFDLLGAPFADRGARSDDAMRALRASLSVREPSYDGEFYSFAGMVVDPCAAQKRVPLWVGGRTARSLRRAVRLGDGWCPFDVKPQQVAQWLARFDVPEGFEVLVPPVRLLDPINDPEGTQQTLAETADYGATIVAARFAHRSADEYIAGLEALADLHGLAKPED